MSACLRIDVADIAKTLLHFDAIKVYRSATLDGTYLEITSPGTRPSLQAGQSQYEFEDTQGDGTAFYCSSYYSTTSRMESSKSAPAQVQLDSGLLISVAQLKQDYLFGLKLTDRQNKPLPDSIFLRGIKTGTALIERRLGLKLSPIEIVDEHHDVRMSTAGVMPLCYLDILPVRVVRKVALHAPGQTEVPWTLQSDRIEFRPFDGCLEMALGTGGMPFGSLRYGRTSASWAQAQTALRGSQRLVGALRVDYAAGFAKGELPDDILDLVAKASCLQPLSIAGDLISPPGQASGSLSIDGFGQSISNIANQQGNAYASRISAYRQEMDAEITRLRSYYRGVPVRVI